MIFFSHKILFFLMMASLRGISFRSLFALIFFSPQSTVKITHLYNTQRKIVSICISIFLSICISIFEFGCWIVATGASSLTLANHILKHIHCFSLTLLDKLKEQHLRKTKLGDFVQISTSSHFFKVSIQYLLVKDRQYGTTIVSSLAGR